MNKLLVFLMAFAAFIAPVFGQAPKHAWALPAAKQKHVSAKQDVFASEEAAKSAVESGDFSYYEPSYLGMAHLNPIDGVTKKVFPLERDAIVQMLVFGGKFAWVVLKKGTVCRYNIGPDGQPFTTPYALHDCGNPIKAIAYPLAKAPVERLAPTPAPAPVDPAPVVVEMPAPKVVVQTPAPQVTVLPAPTTYVQAPPQQAEVAPRPLHPMVLPAPKPIFIPTQQFRDPAPAVPEVKKLHWGWKVLGGLILGYAVYAATHQKKADEHRAVVTDPPSAPPQGGLAFHF